MTTFWQDDGICSLSEQEVTIGIKSNNQMQNEIEQDRCNRGSEHKDPYLTVGEIWNQETPRSKLPYL